MNASSSEARDGASRCSGTPAANATSPIRSGGRPRTSSSALPPGVALPVMVARPPAAATARASASGRGVLARTPCWVLRAMNSAIGQSAMSLPLPITITWSAVFSISDIRWLETNTVRPSAASPFIRFLIHKMPSGSRPLTGSSNIKISGSPSSVAAMPSRWLMPSEKPLDRLRATSDSPTMDSTSSTR